MHGSAGALTSSGVLFSTYDDPIVQAVSPVGGALTGGMDVVVHGPRFHSGSDYRCRFGLRVVRAVLVSNASLGCRSPAQIAASDMSVEVAMNGQQYSRSAVQFAYHGPEDVVGLSPSSGLVTGSTRMRVYGSGFRPFDEAVCHFGGAAASVPATYVSSTEVRCVLHAASSVGASSAVRLDFEDGEDLLALATVHASGSVAAALSDGALVVTADETMAMRSIVTRELLMSGPGQRWSPCPVEINTYM